MPKIRINKLALELKVQNDQIIDELLKKNIPVKNYMSSIDEEAAVYIRGIFGEQPEPVKGKKAAAKAKTKLTAKAKTAVKKKAAAKAKKPAPPHGYKKQPPKTKAAVKAKEAKATAGGTKAKTNAAAKTRETHPPRGKEKPSQSPSKAAAKTTAKAPKPAAGKTAAPPAPVKAVRKPGLKIIKKEEKTRETPARAAEPKPAKAPEPPKPKPERKSKSAGIPAKVVEQPAAPAEEEGFEKIQLSENIPVRDLAGKLHCSPNDIIKELMSFGVLATINQTLELETATKIADKMGFEVELVSPESEIGLEFEEEDRPQDRLPRPPIVTIMGHVDHGKTSLLDAIRQTNITGSEKGGITQHIGAYQVKIKNSTITFLDTPGHEAFTAMRARGAQVTDIVVLVVAADDGIKPQTQEAIDHANAAGVPIVVAINKIDKPDAKPEEVKKQLADLGLLPEDWGGQTIFGEVSALQKTGIDQLLEMILLQSEIMELKANPDALAQGVVIESKLDRGRGPVATVIVQKGTLKVGSPFLAGAFFGKVRALINDLGKKCTQALPSTPVEVVGLPEVPSPGDRFFVVRDEKKARQLSVQRLQKLREASLAKTSHITMDDLHRQVAEGKIRDLNLIIKADVQGSIQAVKEAFSKLDTDEIHIKVIHGAVGGITESDVLLSTASNGIIIGFNVRPTEQAAHLAARENVDVRLYSVIYDAINDIKEAIHGMLTPKFKEKIVGRAEVRKVYTIPKIGVIAGCMVLSGNLERNTSARLVRDNVVVYEGKINSLRRFKDDVKEVPSGYECGLALDKYQDLKQGDIVEPFILEELSS